MVLFWCIMAVIVALVARSRGRNVFLWLLYGFLLWPVAIVHALLLKPTVAAVSAQAIAVDGVVNGVPYWRDGARFAANINGTVMVFASFEALEAATTGGTSAPVPPPVPAQPEAVEERPLAPRIPRRS